MCAEGVTRAVMLSRELGKALCKSFGIDQSRVHRITVNAEAGGLATVTVERFVEYTAVPEMTQELDLITERFELVERDSPHDAARIACLEEQVTALGGTPYE